MSRKAPLACFHSQASHSFAGTASGGLLAGFSAINWRMKAISSVVTIRPRYLHSAAIMPQCARDENRTQVFCWRLFSSLRVATPARLPSLDYPPPAATAPDALATSVPVPCPSATTGNVPWTIVLSPARTPGHRTARPDRRPRRLRKINRQPEKGSAFSFSRHSWAKASMPFLPSIASIATRIRICGVI